MQGHNGIAGEQLASIIERIERIEAERADLAGDIREIYAEAKANGFDAKIIRKIVAMRKVDEASRREQEEMLDLYMNALGMLADLPLGRAAIERAQANA